MHETNRFLWIFKGFIFKVNSKFGVNLAFYGLEDP